MKILHHKKLPISILLIIAICTQVIAYLSFAQEEKIKSFTNNLANQIIDTMRQASDSKEKKRAKIKSIINEAFDIQWMAQFALGVSYRKLSDSQKQDFPGLYLSYLLNNYFPILSRYNYTDSYEILKIQQLGDTDYDVKIKLHAQAAQEPISLKYRAREINGNIKFIDMSVEGVSTLSSQRAEFSSIVQRNGVDGLFKQLESSKK
jgi:phospholipid transport system substrate-binding protein